MSGLQPEPFGPRELDDATAPERPGQTDLASALATGKELEMIAQRQPMRPSESFEDRVWAAIAAEPLPAPATAAREAIRRRRPRLFLASLTDSHRVALGAARPWKARSRAAMLMLAAVLILGSLGGAALAGAVRLLAPAPAPPVTPLPSPTPTPSVTVSPPPSPSPSPSPSESESPDPGSSQETDGPTEPSETDEPDDTPNPSQTPKPSATPDESPEPSASDD